MGVFVVPSSRTPAFILFAARTQVAVYTRPAPTALTRRGSAPVKPVHPTLTYNYHSINNQP